MAGDDLLSAYQGWLRRSSPPADGSLKAIRRDIDRLSSAVERYGDADRLARVAKAARKAAKKAAKASPEGREARALSKAAKAIRRSLEDGATTSAALDAGWLEYGLAGGRLVRAGFDNAIRNP